MNRCKCLLGGLLVALAIIGCGGTAEVGPATATPEVDKEAMRKEMEKSMQLGKPGGQLPGTPESTKN